MRHLLSLLEERPWRSLSAVLAVLALLGWVLRADFGISYDEPAMLRFGQDSALYLFQGGPVPAVADWAFHSPVVQVLLWQLVGAQGEREPWQLLALRHFYQYVLFLGGLAALFALARRQAGSAALGLLAVLVAVLTPRVFAHAFYNPKDIASMTLCTVGVLTAVRFAERHSLARTALHALVTAVAVSLRSSALLIVPITAALLAPHGPTQSALRRFAVFLALSALLTVAVWPVLWSDPIGNFLAAVTDNASRAAPVFYLGAMRSSLPWHYLPVWLLLTLPWWLTALATVGHAAFIRDALRPPAPSARVDACVFFLWFWPPVLLVVFGFVGIFDEWRHLLFLFPAIVLAAVRGAAFLWRHSRRVRIAASALLAAGMALTFVWMVRNHPLHHLYFSVPGSLLEGRMEGDYWGLSYRDGFAWILEHDDRPVVAVYAAHRSAMGSALMLPAASVGRLTMVGDPAEADYLLDTYRGNAYAPPLPKDRLVHAIVVDGFTALGIFRGPDASGAYERYAF